MSEQPPLKQRLVGAIVLVALAVIFIPMILNGEKEDAFLENIDSIPDKPARIKDIQSIDSKKPTVPEDENTPLSIRTPVDERTKITENAVKESVASSSKPSSQSSPTKAVEKPAQAKQTDVPAKEKATPSLAWAVQVGSFSKQMNSINFRDKLRKKGFKAFVEKIEKNGKVSYRVRVGPFIKRTQAQATFKQLQEKHKIKGLVVAHP